MGKAIALRLTEEGARVAVTDVDEKSALETPPSSTARLASGSISPTPPR